MDKDRKPKDPRRLPVAIGSGVTGLAVWSAISDVGLFESEGGSIFSVWIFISAMMGGYLAAPLFARKENTHWKAVGFAIVGAILVTLTGATLGGIWVSAIFGGSLVTILAPAVFVFWAVFLQGNILAVAAWFAGFAGVEILARRAVRADNGLVQT